MLPPIPPSEYIAALKKKKAVRLFRFNLSMFQHNLHFVALSNSLPNIIST